MYAVVMSYPDRSGILAVHGPFSDQRTATDVAESLNASTWIASAVYDVFPMVDHFSAHKPHYGADAHGNCTTCGDKIGAGVDSLTSCPSCVAYHKIVDVARESGEQHKSNYDAPGTTLPCVSCGQDKSNASYVDGVPVCDDCARKHAHHESNSERERVDRGGFNPADTDA